MNSLGDGLCQLGNQIFYQSSWNMEEVEAGIAYFKPDILITIGCDIPLRDPAIDVVPDLCKKYNLFHIYWATEDKIHFYDWSLPFIYRLKPNLVWTIHPECVLEYTRLGISATTLNFGFNPLMFPPKDATAFESIDISLIGTTHLTKRTFRYDSLQNLLVPLVKEKIRTDIWGFGWDQQDEIYECLGVHVPANWTHGFLPYKKTARVYQKSKIVLGVQNALDQVTQRTFEILGSGCFMIATRTDALSEMFVHEQEIILSDSPEQTLDYVKYFLDKDSQRKQIGQRAMVRILKDHTMTMRLLRIWSHLEEQIGMHKRIA